VITLDDEMVEFVCQRMRDERVYRYIVLYKQANDGNSPSRREIMRACGISSTSMVWASLLRLFDKGLIDFSNHGQSRNILVTGGRWVAPTANYTTNLERSE